MLKQSEFKFVCHQLHNQEYLLLFVRRLDASLVSVDEFPVPPQKEKLWLPVPNVVKPHGRSFGSELAK
jgi:hypothetical protein